MRHMDPFLLVLPLHHWRELAFPYLRRSIPVAGLVTYPHSPHPSIPEEVSDPMIVIFRQATEYKKIVANSGIDPTSILFPLAHLGMARAYGMIENKHVNRKQHRTLLMS